MAWPDARRPEMNSRRNDISSFPSKASCRLRLPFVRCRTDCSRRFSIRHCRLVPAPSPRPTSASSPRPLLGCAWGGGISMFGKLTWQAIPFDQPIPLAAGVFVILVMVGAVAFVTIKGWVPYLWSEWITSVDHKRIGVMYMLARCGDAAARLHRRDHDALAAGVGVPVPGLSAAGALQPDLLRPWHDHDLLRRHAVRDRAHELRRAAAARRARRRLSHPQFGQLLADRDRRAPRQHLAGRRRVLPRRLAALSAAVGTHLLARRRRRLLLMGDSDFRRRHAADRRQLRHHHPEDARPRHDLHAHADLLLDGARRQSADRRGIPGADRDARRC